MGKKMIDVLNELVPESATAGEILKALRKRDGLTLEQMENLKKHRNFAKLKNAQPSFAGMVKH